MSPTRDESPLARTPVAGTPGARLACRSIPIAFAALVTFAAVRYSQRYGRLSEPPDWDDVLYMRYAAERVNELYAYGLRACLAGWIHNTPHSPTSCLIAFVSFLTLGLHDWAPYVASGVVVLAVLALANRFMVRDTPVAVRALVTAYLCTVPLVTLAVTDFKPDVLWGAGVAAVTLACTFGAVAGASARRCAALGVLCGLTLLTKPTTSPGTLALLALAGSLGTGKDLLAGRREIRRLAAQVPRSWAIVLGTAIVIAGPFFWLDRGYFNYYIRGTLFGEYRSTWHVPGGRPAQFAFFVTGPGGRVNLAGHLWLVLAAWTAGLVVALVRRDRLTALRAGCLIPMIAACYLLAALNPTKNVFLASPFFVLLLTTAAWWLSYLARVLPPRPAVTLLIPLVGLGAWLYRWPSVYYGPGGTTRADATRLHREVYQQLVGHAKPYPQLTTVTGSGPVREITLSWMATRDRRPFTFARPYSSNPADYVPYMDRSDFVLAQEDHVAGSDGIIPNERVQAQVLAAVRRRDDYRQIAQFTAADGKHLVLFQRVWPTRGVAIGVRLLDGWGPVRGPYPTLNLPMYVYAKGPASRLILTPEHPDRPATLHVEGRPTDKVGSLRAVLNGQVVFQYRFPQPWTPYGLDVPLPPVSDGAELRLEYGAPGERSSGPRPDNNAIMFTRIELDQRPASTSPAGSEVGR